MINVKRILYTGGGTGGSVSPLLAIHEELIKTNENMDVYWIGTKTGPEREMLLKESVPFFAISCGKWRRYFSLINITDLFRTFFGFFQAWSFLDKFKPEVVVSAGGFVSVPVGWAAWLLRIPVVIHQQDVRPGLANRLLAKCAKRITITFKDSVRDYGNKAIHTGNAVRQLKFKNDKIGTGDFEKRFVFKSALPIILVIGGGTGATGINRIITESIKELEKLCNIIHITGKGKSTTINASQGNYLQFEFLKASELFDVYGMVDGVISRAGMGVVSELALFGKASIVIPLPNSHQEENAELLGDNDAAIVIDEKEVVVGTFVKHIESLIYNKDKRSKLERNISKIIQTNGATKIAKIIEHLVISKY